MRVTSAEVTSLSTYLHMDEAAFRSRFLLPRGDRLASGTDERCVFLEDGASTSCAVYPARPTKCRTWPYWPELLDDPEALRRAREICPGIETIDTPD